MNKKNVMAIDELDLVNGGSWSETLDDGKMLARHGLWDKKYPAGFTKINLVADKWAQDQVQIFADQGYKVVYNSSMKNGNEYYNRDGQKVTRAEFWSTFSRH